MNAENTSLIVIAVLCVMLTGGRTADAALIAPLNNAIAVWQFAATGDSMKTAGQATTDSGFSIPLVGGVNNFTVAESLR